jgi:DNA-binding phage protein
MRAVKLDKGINDGVFNQLKDVLSGYNLESVAESAGCAHGTLYNWMTGKTKSPRLCTIVKVAKAVGCRLTLSKVASKPNLSVVR